MNGWHLPTTLDAEYRTSEEPLLPERNAALQFSGRNYLMGLRLTIAETSAGTGTLRRPYRAARDGTFMPTAYSAIR